MRLRAPAYPLITIDPYFNVWSQANKLTDTATTHWTGTPNTVIGIADIDGKQAAVIGKADGIAPMKQVSVDCNALSTTYVYEELGVRLTLIFTSPIMTTFAPRVTLSPIVGTKSFRPSILFPMVVVCLKEKFFPIDFALITVEKA